MPLPASLLRFIRDHRDEPTLSVYVESVPANPSDRLAWRVRLRQGLHDVRERFESAPADERGAFERCEAVLLQRLPEGETTPLPTGWAYFRAAADVRCAGYADQSALDGTPEGIITALRFPLPAAREAIIEQETSPC